MANQVLTPGNYKMFTASVTRALDLVTTKLGGKDVGRGAVVGLYLMSDWGKRGRAGLIPLYSCWHHGFANAERQGKYLCLVQEKRERTATNFVGLGHRTSWESRDHDDMPERTRFGGACVVEGTLPEFGVCPVLLMSSVSGLSLEHADDALGLAAFALTGWKVSACSVQEVLARSDNAIARELLEGQLPSLAA